MCNELNLLLKFEIPEIIFGRGSLKQLGQCSRRLGADRVLLVTDPGIIANGWIDEARQHLEQEGLKSVIYDNVVSNPRSFQMEEGALEYHRKACDVIVAIGGGSPMDTAKGIAILATNQGRIQDFEPGELFEQRGLGRFVFGREKLEGKASFVCLDIITYFHPITSPLLDNRGHNGPSYLRLLC